MPKYWTGSFFSAFGAPLTTPAVAGDAANVYVLCILLRRPLLRRLLSAHRRPALLAALRQHRSRSRPVLMAARRRPVSCQPTLARPRRRFFRATPSPCANHANHYPFASATPNSSDIAQLTTDPTTQQGQSADYAERRIDRRR